jgi:hypothetical protein
MVNFPQKLEDTSDEQLRDGIQHHSPHFGQLESEELTRRVLKSLHETISESNKNSKELEIANYRLQWIMVILTAVTAFPIFKALFIWISENIEIPMISLSSINALSAITSLIGVLIGFYITKDRINRNF